MLFPWEEDSDEEFAQPVAEATSEPVADADKQAVEAPREDEAEAPRRICSSRSVTASPIASSTTPPQG